MNTGITFRIETENKYVLDTGSVIQFDNEDIVFFIDDLRFRLKFVSEGGQPNFTTNIAEDDSEMTLIFHNYDNNLGIGNARPMKLATLDNKDLYLMMRVTMLGNERRFRLINYTWYLEK